MQWGNKNEGTPLHLWPSNGTPAQIFYYNPDGTIRSSLSDLVITASGGVEGKSKLTMSKLDYDEDEVQTWKFERNMIKLLNYSLCFDSP